MCLLFLGIRFGAEKSTAFPTRLNVLFFDPLRLRLRCFASKICDYSVHILAQKNHKLARRISSTTSARVIPSRVFWKPSCARFRTDDMHPLILRLIGHLLCAG
jgi:hypothetical protein